MAEPTIKERLATIETLLGNHLAHHDRFQKWMMIIVTGAVVGVILQALPACIRLLSAVLAG